MYIHVDVFSNRYYIYMYMHTVLESHDSGRKVYHRRLVQSVLQFVHSTCTGNCRLHTDLSVGGLIAGSSSAIPLLCY